MTTKPFEFERSLKELEDITRWFESPDVDLDEGINKFERGMELASELKLHLSDVENRVEKIKAKFSGIPRPEAAETPADSSEIDSLDQVKLFEQ